MTVIQLHAYHVILQESKGTDSTQGHRRLGLGNHSFGFPLIHMFVCI